MWTIEKITEYCKEVCGKVNVEFSIPISINGRLTRTLGRVHSTRVNGSVTPQRMEFSRQFLETSSDESIQQVIKHECAHYLVTATTHESHGHDAVFKQMCAAIGCEADKTSTEVERVVEIRDKYEVFCPNCGKIGGFSRMCKTIQNIEHCTCRKCNSASLKVVQNW